MFTTNVRSKNESSCHDARNSVALVVRSCSSAALRIRAVVGSERGGQEADGAQAKRRITARAHTSNRGGGHRRPRQFQGRGFLHGTLHQLGTRIRSAVKNTLNTGAVVSFVGRPPILTPRGSGSQGCRVPASALYALYETSLPFTVRLCSVPQYGSSPSYLGRSFEMREVGLIPHDA